MLVGYPEPLLCDLFLLIFIALYLLYNVVLVSIVQQSDSASHMPLSPLFWIAFPFRAPSSTPCSLTVGSQ